MRKKILRWIFGYFIENEVLEAIETTKGIDCFIYINGQLLQGINLLFIPAINSFIELNY
jgi:hypothetical protein